MPASSRVLRDWYTKLSALFFVSMPSFFFLSSSANCSASFTFLSISSSVRFEDDFLVGIVVFLSISFVATPPNVSIPNDSGVTSSNSKSFTSPVSTPPWIAAPRATDSSGLISLCGSLPTKFFTNSWTAGILVDPPTKRTLSISEDFNPASDRASSTGFLVSSTKSFVNLRCL